MGAVQSEMAVRTSDQPLLAQSCRSRQLRFLGEEQRCCIGGPGSPFDPEADMRTYAIPIVGW